MDDHTETALQFFHDLLGERSLGLGDRKTKAYRARLHDLMRGPDDDEDEEDEEDEEEVTPLMPRLSDAFAGGDGRVG